MCRLRYQRPDHSPACLPLSRLQSILPRTPTSAAAICLKLVMDQGFMAPLGLGMFFFGMKAGERETLVKWVKWGASAGDEGQESREAAKRLVRLLLNPHYRSFHPRLRVE